MAILTFFGKKFIVLNFAWGPRTQERERKQTLYITLFTIWRYNLLK
jgi:hypothetical protein